MQVDPVVTARELVSARFPGALGSLLAGSARTPHRTATSDLDVLVFLDMPPAPFRETTRHAGWLVELFVQTQRSYAAFLDRETRERRSPLLHMCAEGLLLSDTDGVIVDVQQEARRLLDAGPAPLTDHEREDRRYGLTDQQAVRTTTSCRSSALGY